MVTSSVSPDRADTTVAQPAFLAAFRAALVSVIVPAWLGLISAELQIPASAGAEDANESEARLEASRSREAEEEDRQGH